MAEWSIQDYEDLLSHPMEEWTLEEYHEISSQKTLAEFFAMGGGLWGLQKFYRRRYTAAIATIMFNFVTFGFGMLITWPLGIYEGIKYIRMNPDEYVKTYILGQKDWL